MSLWTHEKLGEKAKADAENDNYDPPNSWWPGRYSVGTKPATGTIELLIFITATRTRTRLPQAASFISAGKPLKPAAALEAALPQTNLHLAVVEREIETWGQQLKGSRSAVPIPVRENLLQEWSILYR
jgi:hypothetical protein